MSLSLPRVFRPSEDGPGRLTELKTHAPERRALDGVWRRAMAPPWRSHTSAFARQGCAEGGSQRIPVKRFVAADEKSRFGMARMIPPRKRGAPRVTVLPVGSEAARPGGRLPRGHEADCGFQFRGAIERAHLFSQNWQGPRGSLHSLSCREPNHRKQSYRKATSCRGCDHTDCHLFYSCRPLRLHNS